MNTFKNDSERIAELHEAIKQIEDILHNSTDAQIGLSTARTLANDVLVLYAENRKFVTAIHKK